MFKFIENEILEHEEKIRQLKQFIVDNKGKPNNDLVDPFIDLCRNGGMDYYKVRPMLDNILIQLFMSNTHNYIAGFSRIPQSMRLGPPENDIMKTYLGQWVMMSYYVTCKEITNVPAHSDVCWLYNANPPGDLVRYMVTTAAVIVSYENAGSKIRATVRYWGLDGKVCEHPCYGFHSIKQRKLINWIYRHKFDRIRRHMRNWVEHVRFKPGAKGYEQSLESWNKKVTLVR